ncbi:hypothetical protein [Actinoplanes missouriensis]|uniref:hypothetical protein n=1 Tax=Actinoplanes missouriensis TaxID=1866 RepID=UPI00369225C9
MTAEVPPSHEPAPKPNLTGGLRALLVGGVFLFGLLIILNPVTRFEDCPNYGGNGNASIFRNELWDLFFLFSIPAWLLSIIVEQFFRSTWRGRDGWVVTLRAIGAVIVAIIASCCGIERLLILCH